MSEKELLMSEVKRCISYLVYIVVQKLLKLMTSFFEIK
jgi:hypothetical protein